MRILITGAAGMVGRKLLARLEQDGTLGGKAISEVVLQDIVEPSPHSVMPAQAGIPLASTAVQRDPSLRWGDERKENSGIRTSTAVGDISDPAFAGRLVAQKPDVVFHLAGIVSGEAEANFDLGYRVNLDGTRILFEALRKAKVSPRVVFTSSIAVYGAPFPAVIPDDFHLTPLTSYGTQKMMSEALLADYTRKGFFDGIGIRLPTICVRPGKPNKAASGFFSNIIREPLVGQEAVLPVPRDVVHTHASPRAAVGFLIHAATIDGALVGPRRNLTMPGVGVTVQEQIDALARVAGPKPVSLIREAPDATIWQIVKGWPTRFEARRARDLGFAAEKSFDEIIAAHVADELGGRVAS